MRIPRLLLAVVGALLAAILVAAPAGAHSGGKVQLFLKDLKVERVDGGYEITAMIVDRDSGEPATGYSTTVEGRRDGTTFPATAMEAERGGVYRVSLPADPGNWTLTVRAVAVPGTDDALPLVDQKQLSFPTEGSAATSGDGGGGGGSGTTMAIIVVVILAGLGGVAMARRRRPEPVL
jgi:hypothetical protein